MKKKGFTLVEMIAVIVLLGILAIIAFATYDIFIKRAKDTKKDADIAMVKDAVGNLAADCIYKKAPVDVESYCSSIKKRTFSGVPLTELIKNLKKAEYLDSSVDADKITEDLESIKVEYDATTYSYNISASSKRQEDPPAPITPVSTFSKEESTVDESGTAVTNTTPVTDYANLSIGDLIKVDTEEFYVVDKTDTELKLLARYILNVGPNKKDGITEGIQSSEIGEYKNPQTGVVVNHLKASSTQYGSLTFADNKYWDLSYPMPINNYYTIYDSNSNLYPYVNNYVDYLKSKGLNNITGSIPDALDIQKMCGMTSFSYSTNLTTKCSSAPYVYEVSYWLACGYKSYVNPESEYKYLIVVQARTTPKVFINDGTTRPSYYGVRPLITMKIS